MQLIPCFFIKNSVQLKKDEERWKRQDKIWEDIHLINMETIEKLKRDLNDMNSEEN